MDLPVCLGGSTPCALEVLHDAVAVNLQVSAPVWTGSIDLSTDHPTGRTPDRPK